MTARFMSPLELREDNDGLIWTVLSPFVYQSDVLDRIITVPVGFKTDFASVPRLPGVYLLFGGIGNEAAVIHDFLYTIKQTTRAQADDVFYEAMVANGVSRWRAWMMWLGVRAGGSSHWS